MDRDYDLSDIIVAMFLGFVVCFTVFAIALSGPEDDPTVSVLIYPADVLEAGEPQRMPLSQAVRNAAAGVPVTLVGVEGE